MVPEVVAVTGLIEIGECTHKDTQTHTHTPTAT